MTGLLIPDSRKVKNQESVIYSGDDLLSHIVANAVPSALEGLTAVFGMGTGVTPPLMSPENRCRSQVFKPVTFIPFLSDNDRLDSFKQGKFYGQAARPISTGKLHTLPRFHTQPISWSSSRGLQHPRGWGYLISGWVSRLYAFSVYPFRT
jgi:hypothetical protein